MRDYLRELREARNLSQQEVADRISISREYYRLIEAGERQKNMDITLIARLATALEVDMAVIISAETNGG